MSLSGSQVVNLLHSGFNITQNPGSTDLVVSLADKQETTTEDMASPKPAQAESKKPNILSIGLPAILVVGGLIALFIISRR